MLLNTWRDTTILMILKLKSILIIYRITRKKRVFNFIKLIRQTNNETKLIKFLNRIRILKLAFRISQALFKTIILILKRRTKEFLKI